VTADQVEVEALLDSALLLDNQLCFLVARLHRALNDRYRPVLGALGLTYPQYLAMLALWEQEPVSVGRLGGRLRLDSGTLSPLLKRLEAAGLVTRTRSADDERSVHVGLTDAGRALRTEARDVPAWIGSCIAGSFDEFVRVRRELTKILDRVEEASTPPIPLS
jgi:DNA-binding MarR family transcriptional regulator